MAKLLNIIEMLKSVMYEKEEQLISEIKELLNSPDPQNTELLKKGLQKMVSGYEQLVKDVKFMSKVSDRLQNRLSSTNENLLLQKKELERAQETITFQNKDLQEAKENLESKIARRTVQLQQAYQELLISNEELDNFVYRASHDLRGPIARIKGLCNLAGIEVQEQKALEYVRMLSSTVEQMDTVLIRLLAVDKLKKSEVRLEKVCLESIVQAGIRAATNLTEFGSVDFLADYNQELEICTDEEILSTMVDNLLEFAVRNSNFEWVEGMVYTPYIHLKVIQEENNLHFYMAYNGWAIDHEMREKIFKLFQRVSNHPEHTGMELYTANIAAEKLGGTIELISSDTEETLLGAFIPINTTAHHPAQD